MPRSVVAIGIPRRCAPRDVGYDELFPGIQDRFSLLDPGHCFFGGCADGGKVSHLTSFFGNFLFIKVDADAGHGHRFVKGGMRVIEPEVAEQVDDGGGVKDFSGSERKIADGADTLLEL